MSELDTQKNVDLSTFKKAKEAMIATSRDGYKNVHTPWRTNIERAKKYTPEEIINIIENGSREAKQKLSRDFFYTNGYYQQVITYYATLLKYVGLLIPNPTNGKSLSTSHISKRYYSAIDFVEKMNLPEWLTNCALRALIDGTYYGVKVNVDKNNFAILDLPANYCCSRFKDELGNDIIEFNLQYFDQISDPESQQAAFEAFPPLFKKSYKKYKDGKSGKWFMIPTELSVCFPMYGGDYPLFLGIIPTILDYDEAIEVDRKRDISEIGKIIVQEIPHNNDGRLVFEPDEAEEMHDGAVHMLANEQNTSVLTTYASVKSIDSKISSANTKDKLATIQNNIYSEAGVSSQIFASTGAASLDTSLNNDLAFMMYLGNKMSTFITNTINELFSNTNITFKYKIMPVSYYNASNYVDSTFKLVGSGFSALLPALALDLSQKDLVSIKDLENDLLKLNEKLIPLNTSYTQSAKEDSQTATTEVDKNLPTDDEGGRPIKDSDEKNAKTVQNIESEK